MEKTNSNISEIIMIVCEVIAGILLLINPIGVATGLIIAFGIVLFVAGIATIVKYFRTPPENAIIEQSLAKGITKVLIGIFCITKLEWIIITFPLITVVYGIIILFAGITKVQWTVDMIRLKLKRWYLAALSAVITIIFAVIIICNPFGSTAVLWTFIAITLIIEAILDIIAICLGKNAIKNK